MIMQHAHHGIENHIVMQLNLNVDEFEICIYMLLYMKKRGVYGTRDIPSITSLK